MTDEQWEVEIERIEKKCDRHMTELENAKWTINEQEIEIKRLEAVILDFNHSAIRSRDL